MNIARPVTICRSLNASINLSSARSYSQWRAALRRGWEFVVSSGITRRGVMNALTARPMGSLIGWRTLSAYSMICWSQPLRRKMGTASPKWAKMIVNSVMKAVTLNATNTLELSIEPLSTESFNAPRGRQYQNQAATVEAFPDCKGQEWRNNWVS